MTEEFFVLGLTILIGFLAVAFFDRTRISQVLLLMLFGFLIGPFWGIVDSSEGSTIFSIMPFISTLALIILLFDGGLTLDLSSVVSAIPKSLLFTLSVFVISLILVTIFCVVALSFPVLHALLLAAAVGGTSSAIVIALVEKTKSEKDTRAVLTLESTLTDSLCILVAVVVVNLILARQVLGWGSIANMLLSSFLLAIVVGASAALAWMFVVQRFNVSRFGYMLTLALVFMVYSLTQAIEGNGGFAVFTFGLVLGNGRKLASLLNLPQEHAMSPVVRLFQREVTFFVRTFFFVYMGLLLSPAYFTLPVMLISVAFLAIFLLSRWAVQKYLFAEIPGLDRGLMVTMLPRGLAAGVLAFYVIEPDKGILIPDFQKIVFIVILLSNIAATLGVFAFDRKEHARKSEKDESSQEAGKTTEKEEEEKPEEETEHEIEEFLEKRKK